MTIFFVVIILIVIVCGVLRMRPRRPEDRTYERPNDWQKN